MVELHNVPFDQQREIIFYVVDRLPNLAGGALDAGGNGAYIAEKAAQRYGSTVVEVKFSEAWYRIEMTAYVAAFGDKSIVLPADADVLADHQALAYVNGYIKVPDGHTTRGANGFQRHGDTAIAAALAYYASRADLEIFDYTTVDELDSLDSVQLFETSSSSFSTLVPNLNGGLH
jgi:phage FluMu gp28-like protein